MKNNNCNGFIAVIALVFLSMISVLVFEALQTANAVVVLGDRYYFRLAKG